MATNLQTKAMLVKLEGHKWSGRAFDREVTAEVVAQHEAADDAGRFTKAVLSKDALKGVSSTISAARIRHYELTLPWNDAGYRLLPIRVYDKYCDEIDKYIESLGVHRKLLIESYDSHIDEARERLGTMFNETDYPFAEDLADKISLAYKMRAVPEASHFVADLADDEVSRIRDDIERQVEAQVRNGVADLYKRIGDAVNACSERLAQTEDGKAKTFRNSLIDNLTWLAEWVPQLNVTEDAALDRMAAEIKRALADVEADELRENNKAFDAAKHRKVKAGYGWYGRAVRGLFRSGGMIERNAERRIRKSLGALLVKAPFFATLSLHAPLVEHGKVETIACDGESLYYNPKWICETPADDIRAAIARVVTACALKHHTRRGDRDYGRWQKASKLVTLPILRDADLTDQSGGLDMSIEEAYETILDEEESDEDGNQKSGDGMGGAGAAGAGQSPPSQDPDGKGEVMDLPSGGAEGGGGIDSASRARESEQKWDEVGHQALAMSKSIGSASGSMSEIINGQHYSEVDWRVILRRFMTESAPTDYSWRRPDRRFIDSGLYLPSLRADAKMGPMVIMWDTSASMDDPDIAAAWAETKGIVSECLPEYVTLIQCDAEVKSVERYAPHELEYMDEIEALGRGGTRVTPALEAVEELDEPPVCALYFTDCEIFDYPEEPPDYPLLWGRMRGHADDPPWGEVMTIKD